MTKIRQDLALHNSFEYDDTLTAGATLQSGAVSGQDDLNAVRSQVRRLLSADAAGDWFEDVATVTTLGGAKKRGVNQIAAEVDALEEHRFLFHQDVLVDITVGAGVNWAILSVAGSQAPPVTAALVSSTTGAVAAQATSFGSFNLDQVTGANALKPANLCIVRDATTGAALFSTDKPIYALLHTQDGTDGHTFDDGTKRVQLSFVRPNVTGTALEACPVADIESTVLRYSYVRRLDLDNLPESVFLTGGSFTAAGGATEPPKIDFTARDSTTKNLIYIAYSSAPLGSKDPTVAEWLIYRYDSTQALLTKLYAGGAATYTNVLDAGGPTPDYETYVYS